MSGGLFVNALLRETGHSVGKEEAEELQRMHGACFARYAPQVRPLPGAVELLEYLTRAGVPWAIATSGRLESARRTLSLLAINDDAVVITRDRPMVRR